MHVDIPNATAELRWRSRENMLVWNSSGSFSLSRSAHPYFVRHLLHEKLFRIRCINASAVCKGVNECEGGAGDSGGRMPNMSVFAWNGVSTWHLRVISICNLSAICRSCRLSPHKQRVAAEKGHCGALLASTLHTACWSGATTALMWWWEALLSTHAKPCSWLGMCISACVLAFPQEQKEDASDVLSFHSRVLLWGKRTPWKLNISLRLAADKDWIISLLLKSLFNFFLKGWKI